MNCEGCQGKCGTSASEMRRLGLNIDEYDTVVALAGNPNTGKSTVFNALTGLKQHTGNWPGKTISRAEGGFEHNQKRYKLVDLPGTYSLLSASTDEEIARDFLLFGQLDCTVVVVDSTSLERNLNLVLQIMEITSRTIVCVNLLDEAKRKHVKINLRLLEERLGVPVVGTSARRGEGLADLTNVISDLVEGRLHPHPILPDTPEEVRQAVETLIPQIEQVVPGLPNARWIAYRLLENDQRVREALESGELLKMTNPDPGKG